MSSLLRMPAARDAADVAAALLHACAARRVFAFHGELGAGKTTLIKALCTELGVQDATSSPTFAIVNDYRSERHGHVYHFDLFRLRDAEELDSVGFVEYVDSGAYCFVEWPELADRLLPEDTVHVTLRVDADNERAVTFTLHDLHTALPPNASTEHA